MPLYDDPADPALFELHDRLRKSSRTIAAAESLTAGLVQAMLAEVSGASAYFSGGVTVYNIHQKVELLGVDGTHAQETNCVSPTVVGQMAHGVRRLFGTDIGVATTGYAEPAPSKGIKTPYAWVAVMIGDDNLRCKKVEFPHLTRTEVREATVSALLILLLEMMDDVP